MRHRRRRSGGADDVGGVADEKARATEPHEWSNERRDDSDVSAATEAATTRRATIPCSRGRRF